MDDVADILGRLALALGVETSPPLLDRLGDFIEEEDERDIDDLRGE